jgi:hypothetical protein
VTTKLRYRLVPASEPGTEEACRLTTEDGQRRKADTQRLFAQLAEQRKDARGNEFIFRGDREELWENVSLFVDEEAECCPFFTYELMEEADGVTLRVDSPPAPIQGP